LITPTAQVGQNRWINCVSSRTVNICGFGGFFNQTLVLDLAAPLSFQLVFYFFELGGFFSGASRPVLMTCQPKLGFNRFGYSTDFKLGDSGFQTRAPSCGPEPSRVRLQDGGTVDFSFRQLGENPHPHQARS